jgi:uncharacterized protein YggE
MRYAFLLLLALPAPALAQAVVDPASTLQVTGAGKVTSPPNVATIHYWVTGEGKTPDEASAALVTIRKAIKEQVGALLGSPAVNSDSELIILPVRGPHCDNSGQPRLSEGECAITGYMARSDSMIRTAAVSKAGTAVGLASRLGASDARLQGFELDDPRPAQRAAMADAVADAARQAASMAAAAGRHLGPVISMQDQSGGYTSGIMLTGSRVNAPPPPPPPPVEIGLTPRPIDTEARVQVTYALLP